MGHIIKHLSSVSLAVFCLCVLSPFKESTASRNLHTTIDIEDLDEGENLTVVCNATNQEVYWIYNERLFQPGKTLSIKNVSRNDIGIYTCQNYSSTPGLQTDIYSFFLDVLYPAKILSVNISARELHQDDDFYMVVKVEGNPLPTTTFKSLTDDRIWFVQKSKEGTLNITIPSVTCTNTGEYDLTCANSLANDTKNEQIGVLCPPEPDPRFPLNMTVKPRVGDNVQFVVHVVGYPPPSYQWWYNGVQLFNHTDTANSTVLTLNKIAVNYFGQYNLVMRNTGGNFSTQFDVQADGPPDPVTDLQVSNVTTTTANMSFVTGFDYRDRQTFFIMRELDGKLTDFRTINDTTSDKGGRHVFVIIGNLLDSTDYSLTVLSGNSRANATLTPKAKTFTTTGKPRPDPNFPLKTKFKPRLGESVTLVIHAKGNPKPEFNWWHNGKKLNSTDDQFNSTVVISDVVVGNFGTFTLNMTNVLGTDTEEYELLADGPPEPVSKLNVSGINETCAHLSFITGYNYNNTQTFIIERYDDEKMTELKNCTDLTSGRGGEPFLCLLCSLQEDTVYNVTVVSKNSRGQSPPVADPVKFTTYGQPKPDPSRTINSTFKPRLDEAVTLSMHAVGYPVPKYQWMHNSTKINSTDTDYTSEVHIGVISVKDFGKYTLTMTNSEGNYTEVYEILADGPPQPVSKLSVSGINETCAHLSFITGYNYNSTQTFIVERYDGGKMTELKNCTDLTSGRGGEPSTCLLCGLQADTVYNVTVVSKNSRGQSPPVDNPVQFTTYGKPMPDPSWTINSTFKPRLGEAVTLSIHAVGYPVPKYQWMHNGVQINSTDTDYTSEVHIGDISVKDFGKYTLTMANSEGNKTELYEILADGPPDTVTKLNYSDLTSNSVVLSWDAGFDYDNAQTFEVKGTVNDKQYVNQEPIKDTTGGKGGNETFKAGNLESSATYNIYLVARNSRGEANPSNTISFTTLAASKSKTTTAEYVGYVMGGLGGVVLIIVIITVIIRCRRRGDEVPYNEMRQDEEDDDIQRQPHHYRYDDAAAPSDV